VSGTSLKLKSASCQFAYWDGGRLRIANYLSRETFSTNVATLQLIRFFQVPRTIGAALVEFAGYSRKSVAKSIVELIDAQLLLEHGSAAWERDEQVRSSWKPWLPEGAFHFMTKDTPFVPWDMPIEEKMKILPTTPPPPRFKRIRGAKTLPLPASRATEVSGAGDSSSSGVGGYSGVGGSSDAFFQTLRGRRTHREFGRRKISLDDLSTLLQMTWGVQGYFQTDVFGELPYKTSPSGGSRHPGEVYVMALKVNGLERGMYHYQCNDHRLAKIPLEVSVRKAGAYCADQWWFSGAAALFIMTAVFARTLWKYRGARAYRVVLLEAGHLCQTLCLTATRLGLAPFSTAALRDSLIEKDLGLDGISESVLYVAGVGLPPCRSPR
jgi:SagB-type dehydrogenase family enzyme